MNQSTEVMYKDIDFSTLQENMEINIEKKLMDIVTKSGIDAAKTASKRVVKKTAEATGGLTGDKIAEKITSLLHYLLNQKINKKKIKQMK